MRITAGDLAPLPPPDSPTDSWLFPGPSPTPAVEYVRLCGRPSLTPEQHELLRALATRLDATDWNDVANIGLGDGMCSLIYMHTSQSGILGLVPTDAASTLGGAFRRTLVLN